MRAMISKGTRTASVRRIAKISSRNPLGSSCNILLVTKKG
jgi:hypothetical protein